MSSNTPIFRILMSAGFGVAIALQAGLGEAAERVRTKTVNVQRTATGHTRDTTITNAQGKTATRDATVTNDAATGTRTRDVQYTGFNGRTGSVESVRQRTANGYTVDTTATGPNGATATRQATVACDKDAKSCTKTVSGSAGKP